jgi:hypothetical protein|tara:strand:+ start:388 stop:573 length:186 start_codon:yes stop_codon:yes gene_type:complete
MKRYRNWNSFKESWLIVSNLQSHTIKALKGTKTEVSDKTFQKIKKEMITLLTQSIERINKL